MRRAAILGFTLLLALAAVHTVAAAVANDFAVALWHRPVADVDARAAMWDRCERAGVTDLFVQTFYHGFTIYPSNAERTFEQRPELEGEDLLAVYIEEGHGRGIRVHAWIDLLLWGPDYERQTSIPHNQYADSHPAWRVVDAEGQTTRQFFVTPAHTDVSNLVTLLCLEIAHQHPELDGIHLDQVRYPGGGEFFFDAAALSMFATPEHPDPRESDDPAVMASFRSLCAAQISGLIEQIAVVMRGIHGDTVALSAAVIPTSPDSEEVDLRLQRWWEWLEGHSVDLAVPKCFGDDIESIHAQAQWVAEVAAATDIPCWIGLAHRPGDDTRPSIADQLEALDDLPIQGVALFCDRWLAEDEVTLDAVHSWVSERASAE